MKLFIFLILVFACTRAKAQQSAVNGIVSVFNSEINTGKRQYVSNGQVEDDFQKAQPALTNSAGQFTLVYIGVNEKLPVSFQVRKAGLDIVNIHALNAVAGQKEIVKISMAHPDSIAGYRRKLYNVGRSEGEKQLDILVKQKSAELGRLRVNLAQNKTRIEQLEEELVSLNDKRSKVEEQAKELARKYAVVNLDDASPLFRTAFRLFQKGELDSALSILNKTGFSNAIDDILLERSKVTTLKTEANFRDSVVKQRASDVGAGLSFKAELHKTKYEFDSTMWCHESLARLDPGNIEYLFNYANFLAWLNQHDKGIEYYKRALNVVESQQDVSPEIIAENKINILINLGVAYSNKNDFGKAEATYLTSLKICKEIAPKNKGLYMPLLAEILNHLGTLCKSKKEFDKAKAYFLDSYSIRLTLPKEMYSDDQSGMASVQANLGVIYSYQGNYSLSEEFYLKALQTYRQLVKVEPDIYEPMLVTLQNNLGALYADNEDFNKSETAYLEAFKLAKKLVKNNPAAYEPNLAMIQTGIGQLYKSKGQYNAAKTFLFEALDSYTNISKIMPGTYEYEMANVLNALGIVYGIIDENTRAEEFFLKALNIYIGLTEKEPQIYEPDIALVQVNLGNVLTDLNKYDKAEKCLQDALRIYTQLAQKNPEIYNTSMAGIFINLGNFYLKQDNYTKSETNYLQALNIAKKLFTDNKHSAKPEITMIQNNLGILYFLSGKYTQAANYLVESLLAREQEYDLYPEVYRTEFIQSSKSLLEVYDAMLDSLKNPAFRYCNFEQFSKMEPHLLKAAGLDTSILNYLVEYYNDRSWYLLEMSKPAEAEMASRNALMLKPSEVRLKTGLAHALLFQGKYEAALQIYRQVKYMRYKTGAYYPVIILQELEELEMQGIGHKDVEKIRVFLKE